MARRHSKMQGFVSSKMNVAYDIMSYLMLEKADLPIAHLLVEQFNPHVTAIKQLEQDLPSHLRPEMTGLIKSQYVKIMVPVFRCNVRAFDGMRFQRAVVRGEDYGRLIRWDHYRQQNTYGETEKQAVMLVLNIPAGLVDELTDGRISYRDLRTPLYADTSEICWEHNARASRTKFWQVSPELWSYREEKERYRRLAMALLKARYLHTFAMSVADHLTTNGIAMKVWPDLVKLDASLAKVTPTARPPALRTVMQAAGISPPELDRTLQACTDFWLQSQLIDATSLPQSRITVSLAYVEEHFDYGNLY